MKEIYVIVEHNSYSDDYYDDCYDTDYPLYYTDNLEDAEFIVDNASHWAEELQIVKVPYMNKEKLIEQQFQYSYSTIIKLVRKDGFFEYNTHSDNSLGKVFNMRKDKKLLDRVNMYVFHSNKNNITIQVFMDSESEQEHDKFKEKVNHYVQEIKTLLDNAKREGIKSTQQVIDALERLK